MKDLELCRHLLGLQPPWDVGRVRLDEPSGELHLYLGQGRAWFGRYRPGSGQSRWRHTNIGDCAVYVHAALPEQVDADLPFLGPVDQEFTHGLAQRVVTCLQAGLSYRQVCELLLIDVHLAWQIRHALSEGTLPGTAPELAQRVSRETVGEAAPGRIPPSADPVWRQLLTDDEPMPVRMLSLKLLLARARQEFAQLHGEEARLLKINDIRRFFIKHESQLDEEIDRLAALRGSPMQGDRS